MLIHMLDISLYVSMIHVCALIKIMLLTRSISAKMAPVKKWEKDLHSVEKVVWNGIELYVNVIFMKSFEGL